jgi:cation diffusion facilitator family transporter
MGCSLHGHGHGHGGGGHGHSHSDNSGHSHDEEHAGQMKSPVENINVRAAMIHVISDFVQSCGVFLAALVIYFKPEWNVIDPICTFFFSILVLVTTLSIMKDALLVSKLMVFHPTLRCNRKSRIDSWEKANRYVNDVFRSVDLWLKTAVLARIYSLPLFAQFP